MVCVDKRGGKRVDGLEVYAIDLESTAEGDSPSTGWGMTSRTDPPPCCALAFESEEGTTHSLTSSRLVTLSVISGRVVMWGGGDLEELILSIMLTRGRFLDFNVLVTS